MAEKYCSECKEKFQDGEAVAVSRIPNEFYHHIFRDLNKMPIDCSMKKVMEGHVVAWERKVHYDGEFYSFEEVGNLANSSELFVEFNEKNTGDIIKGNLKGLEKKF